MPLVPPLAAEQDSLADAEIESWLHRADARNRAYEALPALSAWQRRMEQYPQLTPQAQNELVRDFQAGAEAKRQLEKGNAGKARVRSLTQKVRRGEYAMEMLAGSNFRLVTLIAREKSEERFGREKAAALLPDLVGEANVALVEAATGFDERKGPAFPTYMAKVVRDRMLMVLARQNPIRTPPSWVRAKRIYAVRHSKLAETLGRPPTLEEMQADLLRVCMEWAAGRLSEEEKQLPAGKQEAAMLDRLRKQGMLGAIARLDEVLVATQTQSSIDAPLSDDGGTIADLLGSEEENLTRRVEQEELAQTVSDVLATLPERERQIILHRYGFVDGECWTYARISQLYAVSPERIRQIERAVVQRLRLPHDHYSQLAAHLDYTAGPDVAAEEDEEEVGYPAA